MQFMPRMSPAEKARIKRELDSVDPATGKTQRELMYEAIGQSLPGGIPVHIVGDDVEPPQFVKDAQDQLNRMSPPKRPAPARDDLRKLIQEWISE